MAEAVLELNTRLNERGGEPLPGAMLIKLRSVAATQEHHCVHCLGSLKGVLQYVHSATGDWCWDCYHKEFLSKPKMTERGLSDVMTMALAKNEKALHCNGNAADICAREALRMREEGLL